MATQIVDIDINILEKQLLGYHGISLTNWSGGTPQIASGSKWECAGALYEATSDTDCGTVGEFGAIGNDTIAYCYYSPVDLAFHWTTTAPTWSTSKQGFYGTGGSATYRYVLSVYKDGTGAYTQPTLLMFRDAGVTYTGLNLGGQAANADHTIRFATDASITWDESEDRLISDKDFASSGRISASLGLKVNGYLANNASTYNALFDALSPYILNVNDEIIVSGGATIASGDFSIHKIKRTGTTTMILYGYSFSSGIKDVTITDGDATAIAYVIAF